MGQVAGSDVLSPGAASRRTRPIESWYAGR